MTTDPTTPGMTLREKVARAIYDVESGHGGPDHWSLHAADAAIGAVRDFLMEPATMNRMATVLDGSLSTELNVFGQDRFRAALGAAMLETPE